MMIYKGIETGDSIKYMLAVDLYKTNNSVAILDFQVNDAVVTDK